MEVEECWNFTACRDHVRRAARLCTCGAPSSNSSTRSSLWEPFLGELRALERGAYRGLRSFRRGGGAVDLARHADPRLSSTQDAQMGRVYGKCRFIMHANASRR